MFSHSLRVRVQPNVSWICFHFSCFVWYLYVCMLCISLLVAFNRFCHCGIGFVSVAMPNAFVIPHCYQSVRNESGGPVGLVIGNGFDCAPVNEIHVHVSVSDVIVNELQKISNNGSDWLILWNGVKALINMKCILTAWKRHRAGSWTFAATRARLWSVWNEGSREKRKLNYLSHRKA